MIKGPKLRLKAIAPSMAQKTLRELTFGSSAVFGRNWPIVHNIVRKNAYGASFDIIIFENSTFGTGGSTFQSILNEYMG